MQVADADTVLGNFSNVTVSYFDTTATFTRREGRYVVTLEDATGEQKAFEVTHTFGVAPLQQYLVDTPGGRKQALQFAWDSRSEVDGGQRWYHLYPDEYIGPSDPLHWTGRYFNWNYMCAECHSTDVRLGYDFDTDSFDTTYSEVSVGCEACHGPGSHHIAQAEVNAFNDTWGLAVDLDDRQGAAWIINPATGIAERSHPNESRRQPEACGRCHARRSVAAADYEYGRPLADTHMIALLDENLYHPDGRIQDEVYVYGSFVQSKMYAAGVTCSDCHDAHSATLRAGSNPNDICSTCHLPTKFATSDHSAENVGDCVSCHMKDTTYMGVDARRDHSFRIPDAGKQPDHYGPIIAAGRAGEANDALLRGLADLSYPPIARATMLSLLGPTDATASQEVLARQAGDTDPLVRIGLLRALRAQSPEVVANTGTHLLRDPVRSVRIEAALTFADYRDLLPLEDARAFISAAQDYRDAMLASAFMPDAAISLAGFESRLGNQSEAAGLYEHAIQTGENLARVQNAYGLYRVRSGDSQAALPHLKRAMEIEPDTAWFAYVYGVALNSLGQPDDAIAVLRGAHERFPDDIDIGWALATIHRDHGNLEDARRVATELATRHPGNAQVSALVEALGN